MQITYDRTGWPVLAVGRGAATLEQPGQWVLQSGRPMLYQQSDGTYVLILRVASSYSVQELGQLTTQAAAAARARQFLADQDPEHAEPRLRRRSPQAEAEREAGA